MMQIRNLIAATLAICMAAPASAQLTPQMGRSVDADGHVKNDQGMVLHDSTGAAVGTSTNAMAVHGNSPSGATDTGNPVKVGCRYNATSTNYADGQRVDCQATRRGSMFVQVGDNNTGAAVVGVPTDNANQALNGIYVSSQNMVFNPATGLWSFSRGDTIGAYSVAKGGANIATAQVVVGTTATLVVAARTGRQKVTLSISAANTCAFGNAGVTTTTGFPLQPTAGATITIDTAAAVYSVCSASTTVNALELY